MKLGFVIGCFMFVAAPVAAQDFKSPSGNIHCSFYGNVVRCDIIEHTATYKAPVSCENDYGQSFAVSSRGAGEALCVTDSTYNNRNLVLPYGQTIEGNGVFCLSREDGVRCTNLDGGGFHLSRKEQRVF